MTIIAVKKQKGKIIIAADTQVTGRVRGETKKIQEVGEIVFGSSGLLSELQMMRNFLTDNGFDEKTIKSEKELFNVFSNFYKYLKEKGVVDSREGWMQTVFNSFIIIVKNLGKAYIFDSWCLQEIDDIYCIGSGGAIGLGVLYETGDIARAIEVAKKFDVYCGGDTQIIEIKI